MGTSNRTACESWVKQDPKRPNRKGNSVQHIGPNLYSWGTHWIIGRIVTLEDTGETVYLINRQWYSRSTAKHVSLAVNATYRKRGALFFVNEAYIKSVTSSGTLSVAVALTKEDDARELEEKKLARNARKRSLRDKYARLAFEYFHKYGNILSPLENWMSNNCAIWLYELMIERCGTPTEAETVASLIEPTAQQVGLSSRKFKAAFSQLIQLV